MRVRCRTAASPLAAATEVQARNTGDIRDVANAAGAHLDRCFIVHQCRVPHVRSSTIDTTCVTAIPALLASAHPSEFTTPTRGRSGPGPLPIVVVSAMTNTQP